MEKFYANLVSWIYGLGAMRWLLVALFFIFSCELVIKIIKLHVTDKKFKLKLVPIILLVLCLGIAIFLCAV